MNSCVVFLCIEQEMQQGGSITQSFAPSQPARWLWEPFVGLSDDKLEDKVNEQSVKN